MPEHFCATSCHQHFTLASQAYEGLHQLWVLPWNFSFLFFFFFFSFSFFWMLRHPVFLFISLFPTQSVRPLVVTYLTLCSTSVSCRAKCLSGHQALHTQPLPREAEDFSYGSAFMALASLQPICYNPGFVFIRVKLINIFACGEDLIK